MIRYSIKIFACLIIFVNLSYSNSRIAFSRPGSVIRTPGGIEHSSYNQYIVGFATEIVQFSNLNYGSATYFKGITTDGYNFGLTYNTSPTYSENDTKGLSFLSFHVHKQIFKRNNIGVNIGVHDILYSADSPHRVSLFALFSYAQNLKNNYDIETTFGFGTGYISFDSHDSRDTNLSSKNEFFLGCKLGTPILRKYGGLKFLMEYDGWGLNFGASIPVNHAWTINVALTHFEKIQHFDDLDDGFILPDAPALALGLQMNIPKLQYQKVQTSVQGLSGMYETLPYDESVDSLVNHASNVINALEDSILIQQQSKEQLINRNQLLSVQIQSLQDSLNQSQLNQKVLERNLNIAMKHLSISLQAYYAKNYSVALEETDKAINIFPNLAIAYARKGSIYYQLGDTNRATINWNIALKLDPDYTEVKEVLLKLKNEGSLYLKSTTLPE